MNNPFYEIAESQGETVEFLALIRFLQQREDDFGRLQQELPGRIRKNRERREGKPVNLTRSQQRTLRNVEQDARQADEEYRRILTKRVWPEEWWIDTALEMAKTDLRNSQSMMDGMHKDDWPLIMELVSIKQEQIRAIEEFLEIGRHGSPTKPGA